MNGTDRDYHFGTSYFVRCTDLEYVDLPLADSSRWPGRNAESPQYLLLTQRELPVDAGQSISSRAVSPAQSYPSAALVHSEWTVSGISLPWIMNYYLVTNYISNGRGVGRGMGRSKMQPFARCVPKA
jgi:hypothetical protein